MCGEHHYPKMVVRHVRGSSPHVRGALDQQGQRGHAHGIIPACAGSTRSWWRAAPCPRDHPRMCGEHFRRRGVRQFAAGSSPHVRGAPHRYQPRPRCPGIIPACAGSTSMSAIGSPTHWDHPRMCGEHANTGMKLNSSSGSSPHVRGALGERVKEFLHGGIIPACAGSTLRK